MILSLLFYKFTLIKDNCFSLAILFFLPIIFYNNIKGQIQKSIWSFFKKPIFIWECKLVHNLKSTIYHAYKSFTWTFICYFWYLGSGHLQSNINLFFIFLLFFFVVTYSKSQKTVEFSSYSFLDYEILLKFLLI